MNALAQVNGQLTIVQLPDPEPGAGEIRVRVVRAATNPANRKVLGGGILAAILHGRQAPALAADLNQLVEWIEAGMKVEIDSVVPVRDVAAALARQQKGGMRGKIVVDVEGGW